MRSVTVFSRGLQVCFRRGSFIKDFRNLQVWNKAHALALRCYKATSDFPKSEQYGITSQIRRSAASVAANIAEGCGKRSNGDFQRFLGIAAGSASEVEYHFLLAHDLGFLDGDQYKSLDSSVVEIKRMLASLIIKVESDRRAG